MHIKIVKTDPMEHSDLTRNFGQKKKGSAMSAAIKQKIQGPICEPPTVRNAMIEAARQFYVKRTTSQEIDLLTSTSFIASGGWFQLLFVARFLSCCSSVKNIWIFSLLTSMGILILVFVIQNLMQFNTFSIIVARQFRFSHKSCIGARIEVNTCRQMENISSPLIELLYLGCKVHHTAVATEGSVSTVYFDEPTHVDGVKFVIPIRGIEFSIDGTEWQTYIIAPWMFTAESTASLEVPWPFLARSCVAPACTAIAFLSAGLLGFVRKERMVASVFAIAAVIHSFAHAAAAATGIYGGIPDMIIATCYLLLACFLAADSQVIHACTVSFVCIAAASACDRAAQGPLTASETSLAWTTLQHACLLAAIFCTLSLVRALAWVRALSKIVADRAAFDSAWNLVLALDCQAAITSKRLCEAATRLAACVPSAPVRQCYARRSALRRTSIHRVESWLNLRIGSGPSSGNAGVDTPCINNLEHLIEQAILMSTFLMIKSKELANAANGGVLSTMATAKGDASSEPAVSRLSQRPCVKTVDRAIEKVQTCYGNDPSLLLDCCRQSIVFKNLDDVILCLEAVEKDESLEVVRVMNTMDLSLRSLTGFRSGPISLSNLQAPPLRVRARL